MGLETNQTLEKPSMMWQCIVWTLGLNCLDSNPDSAGYQLCDFGQGA